MQLFFYCLLPYTFAFPFSLTMSNLCDSLMINSKLPCFANILSLSTFFLLEARHTDFSQKIVLLQQTNNTNLKIGICVFPVSGIRLTPDIKFSSGLIKISKKKKKANNILVRLLTSYQIFLTYIYFSTKNFHFYPYIKLNQIIIRKLRRKKKFSLSVFWPPNYTLKVLNSCTEPAKTFLL